MDAFDEGTGYKLLSFMKYPLLNRFHELVGLRGSHQHPLDQCISLDEPIGEDGTERGELTADPDDAFEAVEDEIFTAELHDALDKAIDKLPAARAAAIRGHYFEGKTQGQIAAELHVAPQYVHTLERQGMNKLGYDRRLKAYRDEILTAWAYRGTGLSTFLQTWESSVERAVEKADELSRMREAADL